MPIFGGTAGLGSLFGSTLSTSSATSPTAGYWVCNADGTNAVYVQQQFVSVATSAQTTSTIWENCVTPTQYFALAQNRVVICRERTAEEQRLAAIAQAEYVRLEAERRQRMEAVRTKSRELLLSHLTAAQRKTFEDNKWFIIKGGRTRQTYRIRDAGHAGNIDVMQGSKVSHRLCCHCDHSIPVYDNMLAQKITLEYDESTFLQLANRQAA